MTTTTTAPLNQEIHGVTTAANRALAAANPNRPVQGHIWTPTGGRVLANDMDEIIRAITKGVVGATLMELPEDFLANDAPGKLYDYDFIQFTGHRHILQRKTGRTSLQYRHDFEGFRNHFLEWFFLGTGLEGWAPNPLATYVGFGWWQNGLSGYGQDWKWFCGERNPLFAEKLYNDQIFHIAVQSHRIDRNTRKPVDIFLPVHPPSA